MEKILHKKARHAEYATMCTFTIHYVEIKYWNCVLHCWKCFSHENITHKDTQTNIDIPNIQYHIYKEVGILTLHGQIPIGVKSRCDLFHRMKDDESMGKLRKIKDMVLMNTAIK